jgi:ubiquinone/menaquinone biosynthesis C-methylase UbiE
MNYRKKPVRMVFRVLGLYFSKQNHTAQLVQKSYDRISFCYDETWTHHMRDITADLVRKMGNKSPGNVVDLACGTGYATNLIAEYTGGKVTGVDRSEGMLAKARMNCPPSCEFLQADILDYLKTVPDGSLDIVTCCWGLGYSKPLQVLRQIKRVLKKEGKVGILDNTLFSLREVLYASTLVFMEQPEKLKNLMKFRFLMGKKHLGLWFRLAGLKPLIVWGGSKSFEVDRGIQAIERMQATGAAAGFEYAAAEEDSEEIFHRFAEILEQKYRVKGHIPIIHRYLGGIAIR